MLETIAASMNTDQVHAQGGNQESFFGLAQAVPAGGMYRGTSGGAVNGVCPFSALLTAAQGGVFHRWSLRIPLKPRWSRSTSDTGLH